MLHVTTGSDLSFAFIYQLSYLCKRYWWSLNKYTSSFIASKYSVNLDNPYRSAIPAEEVVAIWNSSLFKNVNNQSLHIYDVYKLYLIKKILTSEVTLHLYINSYYDHCEKERNYGDFFLCIMRTLLWLVF